MSEEEQRILIFLNNEKLIEEHNKAYLRNEKKFRLVQNAFSAMV